MTNRHARNLPTEIERAIRNNNNNWRFLFSD